MRPRQNTASPRVPRALGCLVGGVTIACALAGPARAQPTSPPAASSSAGSSSNEPVSDATARLQVSERPWASGVSPERQEAALKHLQEGNGLLKESLFMAAAKVYRQALSEWDHPGIHYNLALALLNLDQPVEVYRHLESAIRFGADPLDPEKLEHAKSYLRLIEKQVAAVDIRCDVDMAEVSLDGQPLFRAPGRYQNLVRAGIHTITASKPGFTTTSRTENLTYDKRTTMTLKLYTAGELIEYHRRYPIWRPVAVTILGGALLATGVIMTLEARHSFDTFDASVSNVCRGNGAGQIGCSPSDPSFAALQDMKQQGETFRRLATISYVAGGAVVGAGILLLVLDRSTPYRVDPEGERREMVSVAPALSPLIGPGLAGLVGAGRF